MVIPRIGDLGGVEHMEVEHDVRGVFPPDGIDLDAIGWVGLGPIVRGEQPPITPWLLHRDDGTGLLYPGTMHDLHGEPGAGKSWLTLHTVAEVLHNGGAVGVIDYEGVPHVFVERLRALGVPDAVIHDPERVAYHNLPGSASPPVVTMLVRLFTSIGVRLVVIDSMLPALVRNGYEDNSNSDLARFYDTVTNPMLGTGASVVTVDHLTRAPANGRRGARGAGAKLQLIAVSYEVRLVAPFSRTHPGRFRVICAKDRYGTHAIRETVADVHVVPDDDGRTITLDLRVPDTAAATATGEGWRPTHYMERVSIALERNHDAGEPDPGRRDAVALVTGKAAYVRDALNALITDGHVEAYPDGPAIRHRVVRPYRQDGAP